MYRKSIIVCIVMMLTMYALTGCGSTNDEADVRFTYDWKLYSITDEKSTVVYSEWDAFAPKFSSSDGIACTFTNNGKSHKGTLVKEEDNVYCIELKDSNAPMKAEISDDTLTITIKDGAMILVFKSDE